MTYNPSDYYNAAQSGMSGGGGSDFGFGGGASPFDSILNDPLISGANAASGGQPEQVANIAPDSNGSWFKRILGGMFIGLAGGAGANDPAQAFAQGASAVYQARQQEIENARKMAEQKRLQDLADLQATQLHMDLLSKKADLIERAHEYPLQIEHLINQNEQSVVQTQAAMGNQALGSFKSKEEAAKAAQDMGLGLHDSLTASVPNADGSRDILLYRNMNVPYPQGTNVTLPDGSVIDKGAFPTALQADKAYYDRLWNATDAVREQKYRLEQIRLQNQGQLNVANAYGPRNNANGPGALDDDMIRSLDSQVRDLDKVIFTPPQVGWTKDQQDMWQQQVNDAKMQKQQLLQRMNDIYRNRTGAGGNTAGPTTSGWVVNNGQVVNPAGMSVPIGTMVPGKGKITGVLPDGSGPTFEGTQPTETTIPTTTTNVGGYNVQAVDQSGSEMTDLASGMGFNTNPQTAGDWAANVARVPGAVVDALTWNPPQQAGSLEATIKYELEQNKRSPQEIIQMYLNRGDQAQAERAAQIIRNLGY